MSKFSRQIGVIGSATQKRLENTGIYVYIGTRGANPIIIEFLKCCALMGIRSISLIHNSKSNIHPFIRGRRNTLKGIIAWLKRIAPSTTITINSPLTTDDTCYFDGDWDNDYGDDMQWLIRAKLSNDFQALIQTISKTTHKVFDPSGEVPLEGFYNILDNGTLHIQEDFSGIELVAINGLDYGIRCLNPKEGHYALNPSNPDIPISGRIVERRICCVLEPNSPAPIPNKWALVDTPELHGMYSAIAGIAAHEVIKMTGKYMPAFEPIRIDFSRYRRVLGREFDRTEVCALIAGCGAIGCELLKNAAVLGTGDYVVCDMDKVSESNLTRQVLFTNESIGKWKSVEACRECGLYLKKSADPTKQFIAVPRTHPLSADSESTAYNNRIVRSKAVILNALDNMAARSYMDLKSRTFSKTLIDSGTLGTKGHVQVCIPGRTAAWSDVRDPPIKETPVCTLTSFPNSFKHCIEWAISKYADIGKSAETQSNLEEFWNTHFLKPIREVLSNHPAEDKEFWKYGRLVPSIIGTESVDTATLERLLNWDYKRPFDKDDSDTFRTVYDMACLRAELYGISRTSMEEAHATTGLIVPAMITTTTVVAGLQFMEFLNHLSGGEPMDWNVNLALNHILSWDTSAPLILKSSDISTEQGLTETMPFYDGAETATSWDMIRYRRVAPGETVWSLICGDLKCTADDIEAVYDKQGASISNERLTTPGDLRVGLEVNPILKLRLAPTLVYMS